MHDPDNKQIANIEKDLHFFEAMTLYSALQGAAAQSGNKTFTPEEVFQIAAKSGIPGGIQSGISGIKSGIQSGIPPTIPSGIQTTIQSGIRREISAFSGHIYFCLEILAYKIRVLKLSLKNEQLQVSVIVKQFQKKSAAKSENSARGRRKSELTMFPDGMVPEKSHYALARKLDIDCDYYFAEFEQNSKAHGREYRDWNAALKNWFIHVTKFNAPDKIVRAKKNFYRADQVRQVEKASISEEERERARARLKEFNKSASCDEQEVI